MRVTILGSGTCVPSLQRSSCSVMLETGSSTLVFDSGRGTIQRLLETGKGLDDVDFIFYSHLHPDHTAELVPLLFATRYPYGNQRRNPLTLIAGRGFQQFYSRLQKAYGRWMTFEPEELTVVELSITRRDRLEFNGFSVESIPVRHQPESIAFRITDARGISMVYSGDTDYCENLIRLATGADLLICESATPDDLKVDGHLTPSLAGEIAAGAGVRKLVLTHFYPECDLIDIAAECRRTYAGPLVLAEDLLTMTVK